MSRALPRSLTARVALAAGVAVAVAFAIAALTVLLAAERGDRAALDRELQASVQRLARPATISVLGELGGDRRFGGPGGPRFRGSHLLRPPRDALDPGADRFTAVVDATGTVLRAAGALPDGPFPAPTADGALRTVRAAGERWRTVAIALPGDAALQVAGRLKPIEDRANRLRSVVALALLAALGGSVLATLFLSRLALAPLDRLRATAARIGSTADLDARVQVGEGPVEVDELAGEFNAMLARLSGAAQAREEALAAARRFAADAGHELRTPLTSLRASLATLKRDEAHAADPALTAADRDLDRLAALVEQLQGLARGEAGPRTVESLDLGEVADAAIASLRARHPEAAVILRCPEPGPVVRADPDGVRAIFDNLLENAARHGRAGGRIDVSITPSDGIVTLIVDDDGPGIEPAERPRVLGRFVRGTGAQGPGSGLGLAIVRAQAQRHGGVVQLGEAPLGGLRVSLTLVGVAPAPERF
jgi:two-component system, OmpR family, sensor histidine kinase PrrB